jgi:hypothetical protein
MLDTQKFLRHLRKYYIISLIVQVLIVGFALTVWFANGRAFRVGHFSYVHQTWKGGTRPSGVYDGEVTPTWPAIIVLIIVAVALPPVAALLRSRWDEYEKCDGIGKYKKKHT